MLNDLRSYRRNPADHFQFWFFGYEPAIRFLLGIAVAEILDRRSPPWTLSASDPALREMVVIGHSQGGLLYETDGWSISATGSGTRPSASRPKNCRSARRAAIC